jgi:hypothetical protein
MPMSIRSRIVGVSAVCHYAVNVASTSSCNLCHLSHTEYFFSYGSWAQRFRQYSRELLLCVRGMLCSLHGSCIPILPVRTTLNNVKCRLISCRETKLKTLEEIAAAFGDHLVDVDSDAIAAERLAMEAKSGDLAEHVEAKV